MLRGFFFSGRLPIGVWQAMEADRVWKAPGHLPPDLPTPVGNPAPAHRPAGIPTATHSRGGESILLVDREAAESHRGTIDQP
jgi:hypothetical protein